MQAAGMAEQFTLWTQALAGGMKRLFRHQRFFRAERQLHLCETLSLGPHGFLAVVRFEEQRFLVGGTNQSLALLAELSRSDSAAGDDGKRVRHE